MVTGFGTQAPKGQKTLGIDRTYLRLAVLGVLVFAMFTALFSRLWYLQVLASEDYRKAAKENRRRIVFTEPARGRILDRDGEVLVDNRSSRAITIDRQVLDEGAELRPVLRRLSKLLVLNKCMQYGTGEKPKQTTNRSQKGSNKKKKRVERMTVPELLTEKKKELRRALENEAVSPYEPVPVAYDVSENTVACIGENHEDFPGVQDEMLTIRQYPQGEVASHVLGYVDEISREELRLPFFKKARPRYFPGDIIGKAGIERTYDHYLRGTPGRELVIVNSAGDVIHQEQLQTSNPGHDLVLSLDADIQAVTEKALADGVLAAHGTYDAPGGAAVVMDPNTGGIVSMASYPDYNPTILADGVTFKELDRLGEKTPHNDADDALVNRAIRAGVPPGSTFKVVTAGAAMFTDVATAYTTLDCPGARYYPPDDPFAQEFPNWTTADLGVMGFPESLEISCDTFYYELGWQMEQAFGPYSSNHTDAFQDYIRKSGVGRATGIDLPYEFTGVVPDQAWCERNEDIGYCPDGWLPGYTVNMAVGQGDLKTNPLQMAVALASIVNGGNVMEPHVGAELSRQDPATGEEEAVQEIEPKVVNELGLDALELSVIRDGMELVISSGAGTANDAFAGFPLSQAPVGGKTGTAQIGETPLNYAWFISYAPADDPEYVLAVYLDKVTSHGGESAAPIAREIWEGIFKLDKSTDVQIVSGDTSN